MSGPFKMNKSVIKGTKAHSALLATAKTEQTRTHSGDPTLGLAATEYGKSFTNMDVIDYNIKSKALDWSKKKEKTDPDPDDPDSTETKTTTTNTIINRKIENSNKEANDARNILINNNSDLDKIVTSKKKDTPGQYYEGGTLKRTGLPSGKNLVIPKSYGNEDLELNRVILTEDGYREAEWWTKQKKKVSRDAHAQDTSPHPDEYLTTSEWVALGEETYQPKVEKKVEKKVEEKKFKESKEEKKTTRRPREHQYRWGTMSTPGAWKSGGKEAYEKALAEWRARNK